MQALGRVDLWEMTVCSYAAHADLDAVRRRKPITVHRAFTGGIR